MSTRRTSEKSKKRHRLHCVPVWFRSVLSNIFPSHIQVICNATYFASPDPEYYYYQVLRVRLSQETFELHSYTTYDTRLQSRPGSDKRRGKLCYINTTARYCVRSIHIFFQWRTLGQRTLYLHYCSTKCRNHFCVSLLLSLQYIVQGRPLREGGNNRGHAPFPAAFTAHR